MMYSRAPCKATCLFLLTACSLTWDHVTSACPRGCACSPARNPTPTAVSCAIRKLDHFPDDIPKQVQWLDLSSNVIEQLPQSLSQYGALQHLDLSSNSLKTLDDTVLVGLENLIYLNLAKNKIKSIEDINGDSFALTNINLKVLNLSSNHIQSFDDNRRFKSDSIEVLDLSNCHIPFLDESVLIDLPSLTHLNLSRNPIKWLTGDEPLKSNSLIHLDLSECQLDSLRRNALEEMPSLLSLNLSRNKQLNLDAVNVFSKSVSTFDAEFCHFKYPGLMEFENITFANLRGNKIDTLKTQVFVRNRKLQALDLSLNNLKKIESDAFLGLYELETLNLESNDITHISWDTFITNNQLKQLTLSHNPVTHFPKNLTINSLNSLFLRQCVISDIYGSSFTRLPHLLHLDLSQNRLENITGSFESHSLKILNLSYGRLSLINNETFAKIRNLEHLSLKGNRFTSVPEQVTFISNPNLKYLDLSDNPWVCDCNDHNFIQFWYFLTSLSLFDETERKKLKCMSPPKYLGKQWEEACNNELYPPDRVASFFEQYSMYVVIVAITACLTLLVIITIHRRVKKREKRLRSRLPEVSRRQVQDSQVRLMRQYIEEADTSREDESPRQQRVASEPPSYEEAILMPYRGSRQQINDDVEVPNVSEDRLRSSSAVVHIDPDEGEQQSDVVVENDSAVSSRTPPGVSCAQLSRDKLKASCSNDDDHDYDDIPSEDDEPSSEEDGGRELGASSVGNEESSVSNVLQNNIGLAAEELKLMQQLRIEVWSREDLSNINSSDV